ncbi:MAG: response regulator [Candidatus Micrarchaeota archaeon]|nr:response regulator [Candidatus Micrarchaeota archaeon]
MTKKFLLIDNDEEFAKLIKALAEGQKDYEGIWCPDSRKAIKYIKENGPPATTFLDCKMPGGDGYQFLDFVLKEVNAGKSTEDVAGTLVLTGNFNEERLNEYNNKITYERLEKAEIKKENIIRYLP